MQNANSMFVVMILQWVYSHFIRFALPAHQKASVIILASQLTEAKIDGHLELYLEIERKGWNFFF